MLLKVCPNCKGDGFWRQAVEETHPQQNVYQATAIYADGSRLPAHFRSGARPITYEFSCLRCNKSGEIQWKRGKSMTPITHA